MAHEPKIDHTEGAETRTPHMLVETAKIDALFDALELKRPEDFDPMEAIRLKINRLRDVERLWAEACEITKAHCPVEVGESHVRQGIPRLKRERDEFEEKYLFMVGAAADKKLDGYRELGQRCAQLEEERDKLRYQIEMTEAPAWLSELLNALVAEMHHEPKQTGENTTNQQREVWYVRDPESGYHEFASEVEARQEAEGWLDHYRDNASSDGWPEDIDVLEWGKLKPRARAKIETLPAPEGSTFDEHWDVSLEDV